MYRPGRLGTKPDALTRHSSDLPQGEEDAREAEMHQQLLKPSQLAPGVLPISILKLRPIEVQSELIRPPKSLDLELDWNSAIQEDNYAQRVL